MSRVCGLARSVRKVLSHFSGGACAAKMCWKNAVSLARPPSWAHRALSSSPHLAVLHVLGDGGALAQDGIDDLLQLVILAVLPVLVEDGLEVVTYGPEP